MRNVIEEALIMITFILALAVSLLPGCGDSVTLVPVPPEAPTEPNPNPGGDSPSPEITFQTVQVWIKRDCAIGGCHNNPGFAESEAQFLGSQSPSRIANDTMPPSYASQALKDRWKAIRPQVLDYIEANR